MSMTPAQIAQEYLDNLAVLQPSVDVSSQDTDWYIRAQVTGGVVAGLYNDLDLLENDIFPQSARSDAVQKHLATFFPPGQGNTFKAATPADGFVMVQNTSGSPVTVPTSMILVYSPNGNQYQPTVSVVIAAGATGQIDVESQADGQSQNLVAGAQFTITNPPAGLAATGLAITDLASGSNLETYQAAAARLLARLQSPPAGGTATDYQNYALNVPGVTSARAIRFIYGLGTMGVAITSGTSDIDEAINNGEPIVRQPSQDLINEVTAALIAQVPETDCAYVIPPAEFTQDVTVNVSYTSGDGDTIPAGQTLTQQQLVVREVSRAIYKTPPGGRLLGASGFVVAADIEETLDNNLGNTAYSQGQFVQILSDRQVLPLSSSGYNRGMLAFQLADPGTITVVEM